MTIWYPDVSNHEQDMQLEDGTVAVCTKASQGTGYKDPYYAHYKAEAARVGAVFFAYHFLEEGNGAAQAANCFAVTGAGIPVMIDCEPLQDSTGAYTSKPTVQDCLDFAHAFRALGGICSLDYLPPWYWELLGSPSLAALPAAGLGLVASEYTTYSDSGPGWASYGNAEPVVWQYTDAMAYSGELVDFNAYRGTLEQFKQLLGIAPNPAPVPAPVPEEDAMRQKIVYDEVNKQQHFVFIADSRVYHLAFDETTRRWSKSKPLPGNPVNPDAGVDAGIMMGGKQLHVFATFADTTEGTGAHYWLPLPVDVTKPDAWGEGVI